MADRHAIRRLGRARGALAAARPATAPAAAARAEQVGPALRRFRKDQRMTLKELADATQLSVSFLSLVERGRSSISINALCRVSEVLGVPITRIFAGPDAVDERFRSPHITRAAAPGRVHVEANHRYYKVLSQPRPDRRLEPTLITLAPSTFRPVPYNHEGEEFMFVVRGEVVLMADGDEYVLGEHDSAHLQSGVPHEIRNDTAEPAQLVMVHSEILVP